MIAVTGSSGMLGFHIVQEGLRRGKRMRLLLRNPKKFSLESPLIEIAQGDVSDLGSVERCFAGCDGVIHAAAVMSFWKRRRAEMFETNVTGTKNVMDAARTSEIRKVVYVGAMAALGKISPAFNQEGVFANETSKFNPEFSIYYGETKYLASKITEDASRTGLDTVSLIPPLILGQGWQRWNESSAVFFQMMYDGFPFYFPGILPAVGADDVARACLNALEKNTKPGESYFLVSENREQKEIFGLIARALGKNAPSKKPPFSIMLPVAHLMEAFAGLTGREPHITPESVRLLRSGSMTKFDGSKAKSALGIDYTPLDQVIQAIAQMFLLDHASKIFARRSANRP